MPSEVDVYNHLIKFVHLFSGIYLWEYLTTLHFEWEVFTGKRPWRWSFVVYLLARLLALMSTVCQLVAYGLNVKFDCDAWFRILLFVSWFSVAIASFLLALRAIAIWGRHNGIIVVSVLLWLSNMAAAFWSITRAHIMWVPHAGMCIVAGTNIFRWGLLINLFADLSLLCLMFVGVLLKKNATYLWQILYFQGIFWILTAIFTEVPSVVLPFMNMSDAWNLMFQVPHMVLMVTMSTRLYRDLFQYITTDNRDPNHLAQANIWGPRQNAQITIHQTVEVGFDVQRLDEEDVGPDALRSPAELDILAVELRMKNNFRI